MKIILFHRHLGLHKLVKQIEIPCSSDEIISHQNDKIEPYAINEQKLINLIPEGFLPTSPRDCLIDVYEKTCSYGVGRLKLFRSWAKYFDAYSLCLVPDEFFADAENWCNAMRYRMGDDFRQEFPWEV